MLWGRGRSKAVRLLAALGVLALLATGCAGDDPEEAGDTAATAGDAETDDGTGGEGQGDAAAEPVEPGGEGDDGDDGGDDETAQAVDPCVLLDAATIESTLQLQATAGEESGTPFTLTDSPACEWKVGEDAPGVGARSFVKLGVLAAADEGEATGIFDEEIRRSTGDVQDVGLGDAGVLITEAHGSSDVIARRGAIVVYLRLEVSPDEGPADAGQRLVTLAEAVLGAT